MQRGINKNFSHARRRQMMLRQKEKEHKEKLDADKKRRQEKKDLEKLRKALQSEHISKCVCIYDHDKYIMDTYIHYETHYEETEENEVLIVSCKHLIDGKIRTEQVLEIKDCDGIIELGPNYYYVQEYKVLGISKYLFGYIKHVQRKALDEAAIELALEAGEKTEVWTTTPSEYPDDLKYRLPFAMKLRPLSESVIDNKHFIFNENGIYNLNNNEFKVYSEYEKLILCPQALINNHPIVLGKKMATEENLYDAIDIITDTRIAVIITEEELITGEMPLIVDPKKTSNYQLSLNKQSSLRTS